MSADDRKMSGKRTDRNAAGARHCGRPPRRLAESRVARAQMTVPCVIFTPAIPGGRGGLLQRFYQHPCRASLELVLLGLAAGSPVLAADEPLPDAAFLEYLGSWEGTDEDWLLLEGAVRNPAASTDEEQSDSSEESSESKDEH